MNRLPSPHQNEKGTPPLPKNCCFLVKKRPPYPIFLTFTPPPKIFDQAHVCLGPCWTHLTFHNFQNKPQLWKILIINILFLDGSTNNVDPFFLIFNIFRSKLWHPRFGGIGHDVWKTQLRRSTGDNSTKLFLNCNSTFLKSFHNNIFVKIWFNETFTIVILPLWSYILQVWFKGLV